VCSPQLIKLLFHYRTAVKTQAETMVNSTQEKYDECLKLAEAKVPATTPFVENLSMCVKSLDDESGETVVEESESINVVN
jgi:hypothetical protein